MTSGSMGDQIAVDLAEAQVAAGGIDVSVAVNLRNGNVAAGGVRFQRTFDGGDGEISSRGVEFGFALEIGEIDVSASRLQVNIEPGRHGDSVIDLQLAEWIFGTRQAVGAGSFDFN